MATVFFLRYHHLGVLKNEDRGKFLKMRIPRNAAVCCHVSYGFTQGCQFKKLRGFFFLFAQASQTGGPVACIMLLTAVTCLDQQSLKKYH